MSIDVTPRGDDEQFVGGTEFYASLRGVVEVCQAIVFDGDDREPLLDGCVNNFLFAFGDAGRDKDGSFGSGREALLFLLGKQVLVFSMADNWEQFAIQQFWVAITVANHEVISDVQFGLYFFPSFFVKL